MFCSPLIVLVTLMTLFSTNAFTIPATKRVFTIQRMADDETDEDFQERGVSFDQDGKSNVWAIEPKMEVESKSGEEKGASAIGAVGGFAVFALAAGFILTHLPDPDQF